MLIVFSNKLSTHEHSSVQFNIPQKLAQKIILWGKKNIPNEDLYIEEEKYGRENEIHVTVKYGLHTTDHRKIENTINGFKPFPIKLGEISRFVPKDKPYDVVKIEIDGEELSELHELLSELPNSDEHPTYRAHCTLAYVKKGSCSDLSGNSDLKGETAQVRQLTFSSKTGKKTEIQLCG